MRLWHYKLIPYLPKSQLLGQWRELNSIFNKQDKHILINYIYEYPKDDLMSYSRLVISEMLKRGYDVHLHNLVNYFKDGFHTNAIEHPFKNHHNDRYLDQCYFNLQEKYDRGQKDFYSSQYYQLTNFMQKNNNNKE